MNLWILIALEIIFLVLSYILFDGDYFAPPVMTIAVVLIGTMMVIPSYQLWNVSILMIFTIRMQSKRKLSS